MVPVSSVNKNKKGGAKIQKSAAMPLAKLLAKNESLRVMPTK